VPYLTFAFCARGHGASDAPKGDYSLEMLAGDTVAVMQAAAVDRAAVAGMSLGGRTLMATADAVTPARRRHCGLHRVRQLWRKRPHQYPRFMSGKLQHAKALLQRTDQSISRALIEFSNVAEMPIISPPRTN
jgi:pimeloyl-ACP methyl ester carboxylesterase